MDGWMGGWMVSEKVIPIHGGRVGNRAFVVWQKQKFGKINTHF